MTAETINNARRKAMAELLSRYLTGDNLPPNATIAETGQRWDDQTNTFTRSLIMKWQPEDPGMLQRLIDRCDPQTLRDAVRELQSSNVYNANDAILNFNRLCEAVIKGTK